MKRSDISHARELASVLGDAHLNDGAFVGISDARLIVRALRLHRNFMRAAVAGVCVAMIAPVLAVALWPLGDLDRDGRLSANDAALVLHGFASLMESEVGNTRLASYGGSLNPKAATAQVLPIGAGCDLAPIVETVAEASPGLSRIR